MKHEYEAPSFVTISANTLNSLSPYMSSGGGSHGGGGSASTAVYNEVFLCFSGIRIPDFTGLLTPIDHAALIIKRNDNTGYFFSFNASMNFFVALGAVTIGTDGFMSTKVSKTGSTSSRKSALEFPIVEDVDGNETLGWWLDNGAVYTDFINSIGGGLDKGYWRAIAIPITDSEGQSIVNNATYLRNPPTSYTDPGCFYSSSFPTSVNQISKTYHLLANNCYDVATSLLAIEGITIEYDATYNLLMAGAVALALTAICEPAGIALAAYIVEISIEGGAIPNIPNSVYDNLITIKKNGVETSNYTPFEFLEREYIYSPEP
jgi:hypothetical protein